jgi:hypothetical protein
MQFPKDNNGDALRRLLASGFDFNNPHDVEFYAVLRTKDDADAVIKDYVSDHEMGVKIKNIEENSNPVGLFEICIVKNMFVTYENITDFIIKLEGRISAYRGIFDGWEAMQ